MQCSRKKETRWVFGNFRFQNTTRCILNTHTHIGTRTQTGTGALSRSPARTHTYTRAYCSSWIYVSQWGLPWSGALHCFCNLQFAYTAESRIIQPTNLPQKRQLEHNTTIAMDLDVAVESDVDVDALETTRTPRCRMDIMESKPNRNRNRNYAQLERARVSFGPQIIIIIITTIIIIKLSVDNARATCEATSEWAKRRIHSERIPIRNRYLPLGRRSAAARVAAGCSAVALGETKTTQAIPIPQGLLFRPKNNVPQQLRRQAAVAAAAAATRFLQKCKRSN